MSDVTAPALREYPVAPKPQRGAMAGSQPFVANAKVQEAIGFPGELVPDWHDRAIGRLGEMLGKYRSLRVYLDACVHCGACLWNCAKLIDALTGRSNLDFGAGAGGLHSAEN